MKQNTYTNEELQILAALRDPEKRAALLALMNKKECA